MSEPFLEIIRQVDRLSPHEQLQLIAHLTQKLSQCDICPQPRHNVMEFLGATPNLLNGMDAQDYVSRLRQGEFPELDIT